MKKNFKYLLVSIFIALISPIATDAATMTLEEKEKNNNVITYEVYFEPDSEKPEESLYLKIDKTNTADNLIYTLTKIENSAITGSCNSDSLDCTLVTTTINAKTAVALLTVTNNNATDQTTRITIDGDFKSEPITATLKAMSTTTTTTTTTTQRILSSEATLSGITLSVGSMDQAFANDIMEYTVTGIKDTVNSVTITPNCENNCSWAITCPTGGCSVSNTRRVTLADGANKVAVNVTSEDGSANKTYIINVYKGEVVASSAYLSELKINDADITPNFDSMTNDYTVTVGLDIEKLDIITTTEDPSAEVLIKGNDKLVEGENTVTITVTSSDGENKQVYTILVNKEALEEEPVEEEEEKEVVTTPVKKKNNNIWLIILLSVLGLGLIIIIFLIIFKKKKKNKKNSKNDRNNKPNGSKEEKDFVNKVEMENTESLNILNETTRNLYDEPKQDIDEALDDLMQTKRLELGDLNF